ncbi:DUF3310 domain-containing protein [Slackia exigua]|uniref:DUF3310 domain-containing protein n=1 Tax=Slackia exigua TaxID=84109 RepID=UPI0023F1DFBE|nr:DUF3310 domain-containing protein [Slackia exigua]
MDNYCNEEKGGSASAVEHPAHYTAGDVECIDAIRSALGDGFADYCLGNVIKYVWRHRMKGGAEDLEKARVYLDWAIEAEAEGAKEEFIPIEWWLQETTRRASEKESQ